MSLCESVRAATARNTDPNDAATVDLAIRYAAALDQGADLGALGPKLLATLEALLLSPRARAAVAKGMKDGDRDGGSNPLDELRARRARQDRTPAVDAPAS